MAWWNPFRRPDAAAPPVPTPAFPAVSSTRTLRSLDDAGRDGIINLMAGLGSNRDRTASAFYDVVTPLNQVTLESMYRGSWLPRRIVDTVTEDMTREWLATSWSGHDDDEEGPRAVEAEENRLNVRGNVTEGVRWGRLFGGATLMMGIRGQQLDQPLEIDRVGKGDLEWLMVNDRWWLSNAGEINREPGPACGFPLYYNLVDPAGGNSQTRVHYSRIIRFGGAPLPIRAWVANARWDDSVLQSPYDVVKRYDTFWGGIGSLIWDAKTDVMQIDELYQLLASADGETELRKRFDAVAMAKGLFNVLVMDSKDKYEQKQITFAGLKDIAAEFRSDICGAADIPMTRLFGASPGGLNATGESDLNNYYDHLASEQETRMRPQMMTLYQVLVRSALGSMPEHFTIKFNPLWQMSDKEQADIEKTRADRDKVYVDMGAIPVSVVTRTLQEKRTYSGLEQEDVDLVEKLEAEPPPPPPTLIAAPGQPGQKLLAAPAAASGQAAAIGKAKKPNAAAAAPAAAADASQLHAVQFDKKHFDRARAEAWLKRNGKQTAHVTEGDNAIEYRQQYAGDFEPGSFRQIGVGPGVSAIIGHPKAKNDGTDIVARRTFQGFNVAVENPAGTARRWYDANSNEVGMVMMRNDYGFFEDHLGSDGDELDCYLGPDENAKDVFVVHQLAAPGYSKRDEDKVMLGWRDAEEAKRAYLGHRNDGDKAFGGMAVIPVERFRAQLQNRAGTGKIRS